MFAEFKFEEPDLGHVKLIFVTADFQFYCVLFELTFGRSGSSH